MTTTSSASSRKAALGKAGSSDKPKRSTTERLLGIPSQPTRQQALDTYGQQGAETFADRRLLDITVAVQRIAFWVSLWSVLSLVGFGLFLLVTIANSR